MGHARKARTNPAESLFVAMDGAEVVGPGLPHYNETAKGEGEQHLQNKIIMTMVAGEGVWIYDHMRHIAGM